MMKNKLSSSEDQIISWFLKLVVEPWLKYTNVNGLYSSCLNRPKRICKKRIVIQQVDNIHKGEALKAEGRTNEQ